MPANIVWFAYEEFMDLFFFYCYCSGDEFRNFFQEFFLGYLEPPKTPESATAGEDFQSGHLELPP
ncbi:hypothetical protein HanXRQr2_Chr07g0310191 [Helianthus annuus]|uniref:Uncharacterized protein n=1 Tax=Helianthus annuus TaxID=4232 RepID=A0A9K3IMX6_HELAN|nr:hypothetical protein HanXRQr2_Chr07g0310191 [Helianthus annuus]